MGELHMKDCQYEHAITMGSGGVLVNGRKVSVVRRGDDHDALPELASDTQMLPFGCDREGLERRLRSPIGIVLEAPVAANGAKAVCRFVQVVLPIDRAKLSSHI
jgi:hypothetical protein